MQVLMMVKSNPDTVTKEVPVDGYVRKDGVYVAPHTAIRHVSSHPVPPAAPDAPKPEKPKAAQMDLFADDPAPKAAVEPAAPEPAVEAPAPDPVPDIVPEPETPAWEAEMGQYAETAPAPDGEVDAAEDRQDLAEAAAKDPHSDETRALAKKVAAQRPDPVEGDLDPSSPNYRYRDTGYVAGSRKEIAAMQIRSFAKSGTRVRVTDVDWAAIEENPREAKELIVKENLFGDVDWEGMRADGLEPGAGFVMSRVYASVAAKPVEDTPAGRHDYSFAMTSLRDRMDKCRTVQDVAKLLEEMRDERDGAILNDRERELYSRAREFYASATEGVRKIEDAFDELHRRAITAESEISRRKWDMDKRRRRKWKVDPKEEELVAGMEIEAAALREAAVKFREDNGMNPITHKTGDWKTGMSTRFEYPFRKDQDAARQAMDTVRKIAFARNMQENSLMRAWRSLGKGFNSVLDYRGGRDKSESFGKHMAAAKAGRVTDWAWMEKGEKVKGATKRSVTFQLLVADDVSREGGREVHAPSTEALKSAFNLRDVQSGNWVLDDLNSAKFHVESCAGAFADLADIIGIDDSKISFNGRLAMAFGARGKGGAKAHYEPVHRIINMTKMAGAGSLAHEWFHCVDNLVKEAMTGQDSGSDDFATETPAVLDHGELQSAFRNLADAMLRGNYRRKSELTYTEAEEKWAAHNMQYSYGGQVREGIKSAATVQAAVDSIDALYASGRFGDPAKGRAKKQRESWRKIAIITKGGNPERKVVFETGPGISKFLFDAVNLDQGVTAKYWSQPREMAARAFAAYVDGKLKEKGRQNTYLVSHADNKFYVMTGGQRPYADGEEKERINAAFDKLFEIVRRDDVLSKAAALLDQDWVSA